MRQECRECFPHNCRLAIPTCIKVRASRTCRDAYRIRSLAGSFEVGGGENVPGIPGACATRNYVNPGCGRSRRSPDLEVSIAPGRRAEILIAVTVGRYCMTRACSRSGHTICRRVAMQHTNTIPLSSAKLPAYKLEFCE